MTDGARGHRATPWADRLRDGHASTPRRSHTPSHTLTAERFDDPRDFEAYVHAVQWGAISQFDLDTQTEAGRLQAPFRSGIHIQDYQLDPLVRALQMPRVSLLIADDVGLGKTIEAGLVAQELVLRHRARRIPIVCPAGLQVQWREQMRDKFGLRLKILDRAGMAQLRRERGIHGNPWGNSVGNGDGYGGLGIDHQVAAATRAARPSSVRRERNDLRSLRPAS